MITVRFPSGFSVQYNHLSATKWGNDGRQVLFKSAKDRDAGKGWLVSVPADCIVELTQPCRTYNPTTAGTEEIMAELAKLAKEIRSLKRALAKKQGAR